MLTVNPANRITAQIARRHPWFRKHFANDNSLRTTMNLQKMEEIKVEIEMFTGRIVNFQIRISG